jgi:hypothetical protein
MMLRRGKRHRKGLVKLLSADYNIRSLVCFLFTCLKLRSPCNFSGVGRLANLMNVVFHWAMTWSYLTRCLLMATEHS